MSPLARALILIVLGCVLAGCGKRGSPERLPEWGPEREPPRQVEPSSGVIR